DRYEAELRPAGKRLLQISDIQSSMHRRNGTVLEPFEQREVQQVGVEMENVESASELAHLVQHLQMRRLLGFERPRVEPEGLWACCHQLGLGTGIAGRKQHDLVTEVAQSIAQVRHHSLGPSVELGRDG